MGARRADLEEEIELLRSALLEERRRNRALWEENQRLVASLLSASAQYERLVAYIKSLRDWASRSGGGTK